LRPVAARSCLGCLDGALSPRKADGSRKYGNITFSADDRALLPSYAKTGTWAERTNRQLAEFFASVGNRGACIDVGANVGLTTIPIARHPGICCTATEPDPTNFRCLSENISANCPHNNVTLRNIAIFSERKRLSLELDEHNLGDHRIRLANSGGILNEQNRKVIAVDALPLDDIPVSGGTLAIKLDVQGAEAFVIRGGRNILDRAGLLIRKSGPMGCAASAPISLRSLIYSEDSTLSNYVPEKMTRLSLRSRPPLRSRN
jgi:FkbM family methyltransferase